MESAAPRSLVDRQQHIQHRGKEGEGWQTAATLTGITEHVQRARVTVTAWV